MNLALIFFVITHEIFNYGKELCSIRIPHILSCIPKGEQTLCPRRKL